MNNIINRTRNIMNKININIVVRYVCVWLFVIQFIPSVVAQTEEEVYNEKVVVISGYQPVLQESEKINVADGEQVFSFFVLTDCCKPN